MQDQKTKTLTAVLSEVLANLAFMIVDDDDSDPPAGECWLETTITYDGYVSGSLAFMCTRSFAVELAVNLLGMPLDDDASVQASDDAVKEFMNVVCGQYVTAAYGTDEVFNLTIPEVVELSATPDLSRPESDTEEVAVLSVDGEWIKLVHARNA